VRWHATEGNQLSVISTGRSTGLDCARDVRLKVYRPLNSHLLITVLLITDYFWTTTPNGLAKLRFLPRLSGAAKDIHESGGHLLNVLLNRSQ
jgi:hypothetical protein